MNQGIFCISIDLELLWGRKDLDYSKFIERTKKERKVIKRLLSLFTKYDISATWATVGKMIGKGDPLWYGNDIIKEIKKNKNQEIGSHSYSHAIFTEISKSEAEKEIKKFRARSFVFPRNKVKYLGLLKKYGFKSFRGPDKRNWEILSPSIPPVYKPTIKNGLVNIPGSMYFVSARGMRKYIPVGFRAFKVKLGIKNAIKQKKIFHLWFHPVDLIDQEDKLMKDMENILKYAYEQKDKGNLMIKNMQQIAKTI